MKLVIKSKSFSRDIYKRDQKPKRNPTSVLVTFDNTFNTSLSKRLRMVILNK